MQISLRNPIILALDLDDVQQAMLLAQQLAGSLGAIKIGPRLVQRLGFEGTQKLSKLCPLFIDNKYYDIPSTMLAAVRSAFEMGASLVTVHALSGPAALAELAKLELELNKIRPFKVLCVSILTSYSQETLPQVLRGQAIDDLVTNLILEVKASGLTGIVCSPRELAKIQNLAMYSVVPGIRDVDDKADDQSRTMSAAAAIQAGASALVIGRPILQAPSPITKLEKLLVSL